MKPLLNVFLILLLLCVVGVVPVCAEKPYINFIDFNLPRNITKDMTFEEREQHCKLILQGLMTIEQLIESEEKVKAAEEKAVEDGVPIGVFEAIKEKNQAALEGVLERLSPEQREAYYQREELIQQELLKRKSSVSD